MRVPKRQEKAHKSYLVSPIEYAKGFVCFGHIADLESSSQGGNGRDVMMIREPSKWERWIKLGSPARVFIFLFGAVNVLNVCSGARCYAGHWVTKWFKYNGYLLVGDREKLPTNTD